MASRRARPEPLTALQRDCYGVIAEFNEVYGRSPSHREIREELDVRSRASVSRLVEILVDKGWARRVLPGAHYAVEPLVPLPALPEGDVVLTTEGRAFIEARIEQ